MKANALHQFTGIIPARYSSSRFPGKPLALIGNKPMIQRVYEQACKALSNVYVATDDTRIYDTVLNFGGKAIMTSTEHQSGTDRCAEAVSGIMTETGNPRR
jgi:3-deoxy-manno-octulosonate cytidylyltransferase (CMP-KDO synthetase)